jgi:hypothetical protein
VDKATFHVGCHVTIKSGRYAGASGRIIRENRDHRETPIRAFGRDVYPPLTWVIWLDKPFAVPHGREFQVGAYEDELASFTVPASARPVSVGALKGGSR